MRLEILFTCLIILGCLAVSRPASQALTQVNRDRVNKSTKQASEQQGIETPKPRSFHGRLKKNQAKVGDSQVELQPSPLTAVQIDKMMPGKKSDSYAMLSVRQPYVEHRGYLNFIYTQYTTGEIRGQTGNAHLKEGNVEIGVKPAAAGRLYVFDCLVKSPQRHLANIFRIEGPDGHSEQWAITTNWQHLVFTISADDTDWYVLVLHSDDYYFSFCNVREFSQ